MKYLLLSLLLFSCATSPSKKKVNYSTFLAQQKEQHKNTREWKSFLAKQRKFKMNQLQGIEGLLGNANSRHEHNEDVQDAQKSETSYFGSKTSALELRKLTLRKKEVQKDLFYLNFELSQLESTR